MSANSILVTLTGTSPTTAGAPVTAFVADPGFTDLSGYKSMRCEAQLVGATGGALDVYLQTSYDGVTWTDYAHFAQQAAAASANVKGFTATRVAADGIAAAQQGGTPGLTVNTVRGGCWGRLARLAFVAAASTTAGAAITVTLFLSN